MKKPKMGNISHQWAAHQSASKPIVAMSKFMKVSHGSRRAGSWTLAAPHLLFAAAGPIGCTILKQRSGRTTEEPRIPAPGAYILPGARPAANKETHRCLMSMDLC